MPSRLAVITRVVRRKIVIEVRETNAREMVTKGQSEAVSCAPT